MEALQNFLTIATEAIAIIGITGIVAHAFYSSHCQWIATYCPEIKPEVKAVVTKQPEIKPEAVKLQPMSVGAAPVNYAAMTSEQLRRECALQNIDWRNGGDYGKPMKKAQMISALR